MIKIVLHAELIDDVLWIVKFVYCDLLWLVLDQFDVEDQNWVLHHRLFFVIKLRLGHIKDLGRPFGVFMRLQDLFLVLWSRIL